MLVTTAQIHQYLKIEVALTPDEQAQLDHVHNFAENLVKGAVRRHFEDKDYVQVFTHIDEGQAFLHLADRPLKGWTGLYHTDGQNVDGSPVQGEEITDIWVDWSAGIIHHTAGSFPEGDYKIYAAFNAGYTDTEITNAVDDVSGDPLPEVHVMRGLVLSVIAREYGIVKENKRHLSSLSYGDESVSIRYDFDFGQLRAITMLKLDQRIG